MRVFYFGLLLLIIGIESCEISILWDSTYIHEVSQLQSGLILPPNTNRCDFHLGWVIRLHVTTPGRYENLWRVDNYEDFKNCDPTNAKNGFPVTDVHSFALSPGTYTFDSVYYFFSTSNGSLESANEQKVLPNCRLKLSFNLRFPLTICDMNPKCNDSFFSSLAGPDSKIQLNTTSAPPNTTTISSTVAPIPTKSQNFTQGNFLLFSDTDILLYALPIIIAIILLSLLSSFLFIFAFFRAKRHSNDIKIEILDATYINKFKSIGKELDKEVHSERTTPISFSDSNFSFATRNSNVISTISLYRTPSVSVV